jgi:hypothetical protein
VEQIKWSFLFLALGAAVSLIGVGIAIGQGSLGGTAVFLTLFLLIMGVGFMKKKKIRGNRN